MGAIVSLWPPGTSTTWVASRRVSSVGQSVRTMVPAPM